MTDEEKAAAEKAAAEKAAADKVAADQAAEEAKKNTPEALKAKLEAAEKAAADYKADMLKYKAAAQQTAEEKEKIRAEAAKAEEEKLKAGSQFKELYERSEARAKELDEKNKRQAAAFVHTLKVSAVTQAAQAAGLLPAALPDLNVLDMSAVLATQAEDGTISIQNVENFITQTKTNRPHWFGTGTPPKIVLPGGGNGNPGPANKPTMEELLKLEASDPDAYQKAMKTHFMV